MRIFVFIAVLTALFGSGLCPAAEPTANLKWTSAKTGKSLTAMAVSLENGIVTLEKLNGETLKVPLDQFVLKNRNFLKDHFADKKEEDKPANQADPKPANDPAGKKANDKANNKAFPVEQGTISDPIEAAPGAKYHVYIPDVLKADAKDVPALIIYNGRGGKESDIDDYMEFAETFGFIIATSIDNKKGKKNLENLTVATAVYEHILRTLPVSKQRVYLAGNGDGGALAIMFSERIRADGVLTVNAYSDDAWQPSANNYYFLSGSNSKMRYATAFSHRKFRNNTPYVLYDGNSKAPDEDYLFDALLWLHVDYLGKAKSRLDKEAKAFEKSMLQIIEDNQGSDDQRAYLHALMLRDEYKISGDNLKVLDALIKKIEEDKSVKKFIEGREEFAKFAKKYLCDEGKAPKPLYKDERVIRAAKKLVKEYDAVPYITEVFESLQELTD